MGRIQSNVGLTTGIDIQKTVDQLMAVSARPRDALEVRIKGLQAQQVVLNELTALVVGVQLQSDRIGNASNVSTIAVASSKPDAISATIRLSRRRQLPCSIDPNCPNCYRSEQPIR